MKVFLTGVYVPEKSDLFNYDVDEGTFMGARKHGLFVLELDRLAVNCSLLQVIVLAGENHGVEFFRAQKTITVEVIVLNKEAHFMRSGRVATVMIIQEVTNFLGSHKTSTFAVKSVESRSRREVVDPADVLSESFEVALTPANGEEELAEVPF